MRALCALCAGAAWALSAPVAWACNTAAECNAQGQFNRATALYLRSTYPSNSSSTSSGQGTSGSALSSALANSFSSWEARRNAESDALLARERALDREALRKPIVRFSQVDIDRDRRDVLIYGAQDGRALRQNQLGVVLLTGQLGFEPDPQKGLYWLRKAASQGDHNALINLAEILTQGQHGVPADPASGLQMYALFIGSSGLNPADQAAFLLNKTIEVFKRDDRFYPQLIAATLKAHAWGVAHAPQVLYKLILVSPPSFTDPELKALLSAPGSDPYLQATRAFATATGRFGMAKDKAQGRAILKTEVDLGHQPAIDLQLLMQCLQEPERVGKQQDCAALANPFYL